MKTWIKRTLFGFFGIGIITGGLSACGHRHHAHGMVISAQPGLVAQLVLPALLA